MGDLINVFITTSSLVDGLIGIFWAILFLQSGLDKVFDWKGNLGWLKGHFEKSFLSAFVTPMLATLTIIELLAGTVSLFGIFYLFLSGSNNFIYLGVLLSLVSILMLFFGQRIAKDYDGAKTIAIYFGIALLSLLLIK